MVDWDLWQTLLAVFRFGTHASAAKALRVDPTTVGRRLKLLERRIGDQLFFRQDGRLQATSRCESLLDHLETAAQALRAAEQEGAGAVPGTVWRTLRLTAAPYLIRNYFAPALGTISSTYALRIELMGVTSNASLSRREADIAVRIDDHPADSNVVVEQVGVVSYAVYCASDADPESLPWAGLMEEYFASPGGRVMAQLAGREGFRFRTYHFDPLYEITCSGVARAVLPRFTADRDARLKRIGESVLEHPLWMLYHRQDRDVSYLEAAREWVREVVAQVQ